MIARTWSSELSRAGNGLIRTERGRDPAS